MNIIEKKIYRLKFAILVKDHTHGARSGKMNGKMLNIAL